jgi:serine/threonine protein kinase
MKTGFGDSADEADGGAASAKAEQTRTCPVCRSKLMVRSFREFCPVCVLRGALAPAFGSHHSSPRKATRPSASARRGQRFENYQLMLDDNGRPFDVDLHCPVTLKVITEKYLGDEAARLRFLREARAAASLRHSNVASVLHLGRTGSSYFYAMEFVEGETLENLIKRSGRLKVNLALEIATQAAAGLAAVHKQKLVHRDIKPSNIMVNVEEGDTVQRKSLTLGWRSPHPTRPLKRRSRLPELLLVHQSSPAQSSSPE